MKTKRFRRDRNDSINRYLTALSIYRLKTSEGLNFTLTTISKELGISNTVFSCAEELGILTSTRSTKKWLVGIPDLEMAEKVNNLVRKRADEAVAKSNGKHCKIEPELDNYSLLSLVGVLRSDQTSTFDIITSCSKSILNLNKELGIKDYDLLNCLKEALKLAENNNEKYNRIISYMEVSDY